MAGRSFPGIPLEEPQEKRGKRGKREGRREGSNWILNP